MTRPSNRGLTLIELVAAISLAAVLMVAVLGVLASFSTQWRTLTRDGGTSRWKRQLAQQLRWDLLNSRLLRWNSTTLQMSGFAGRSSTSGRATLRPTGVTYSTEVDGNHSWLLRTERDVESRSNRNLRRELVCRGVRRIELRSDDDQPLSAQVISVPASLRLMFYGESAEETVWDATLLLYQEVTGDGAP